MVFILQKATLKGWVVGVPNTFPNCNKTSYPTL